MFYTGSNWIKGYCNQSVEWTLPDGGDDCWTVAVSKERLVAPPGSYRVNCTFRYPWQDLYKTQAFIHMTTKYLTWHGYIMLHIFMVYEHVMFDSVGLYHIEQTVTRVSHKQK